MGFYNRKYPISDLKRDFQSTIFLSFEYLKKLYVIDSYYKNNPKTIVRIFVLESILNTVEP